MSTKYLSYTYLIGWSHLDKWYYGVRTTQKRKTEFDVIIYYPTSSDYVKTMIKECGNPDVIHIDKTFEDENEAKEYEYKVLQEHQVRKNDWWINKNDWPGPPSVKGKDNPFYGRNHTPETIQKQSEAKLGENNPNYGRKHTPETIQKQSEAKKGKNHPNYGKEHTKKHRQNISNSLKGKNAGEDNPMYGKPSPNRKKVKINGVIFDSIKNAAEKLNIPISTIRKRLYRKAPFYEYV